MRRLPFAVGAAVVLAAVVGCEDLAGPSGDPVDLRFAPCLDSPDAPTWFAVQDGDGAWQRVLPSGGRFDFTLSSGRGGIAMHSESDGLFILYATTEELQANLPDCGGGAVRTVTGTVTGYTASDRVRLQMSDVTDEFAATSFPAPTFWLLSNVDDGVTDLVATRFRIGGNTSTTLFEEFPNNVVLRRGVSGLTTSTVDFSSSTEAGAPLLRTVNVTNVAANETLVLLSDIALATTRAKIAEYHSQPAPIAGAVTGPFYGVPGSRLNNGESQMLFVNAYSQNASTLAEEDRFATLTYTDPIDRTFTLGPALGTISLGGGARPSATYTIQNGYDSLFEVVFSQDLETSRQIDIVATSGYLGTSSGTITLAVPDLSGAAGFSSSWLMVPGTQGNWLFLATDADLSILNNRAQTYQGADRSGSFIP